MPTEPSRAAAHLSGRAAASLGPARVQVAHVTCIRALQVCARSFQPRSPERRECRPGDPGGSESRSSLDAPGPARTLPLRHSHSRTAQVRRRAPRHVTRAVSQRAHRQQIDPPSGQYAGRAFRVRSGALAPAPHCHSSPTETWRPRGQLARWDIKLNNRPVTGKPSKHKGEHKTKDSDGRKQRAPPRLLFARSDAAI